MGVSEDAVQVSIESILRAKSGNREPSRVLVKVLKKLLCIDRVNLFLREAADKKNLDFFKSLLENLKVKVEIQGIENLPSSGERSVFASNHPLGALDAVAISYEIGKNYPEGIIIPANDVLMYLKNIQDLFVPVNKMGGQERGLVDAMNEAYCSVKQVFMFPSGVVSRKNKGKIKDLQWNKSFITKAIASKRNVVPIFVDAKNSNLFYWVAGMRKRLKIKFNIEMLLLPRELFKQEKGTFTIKIGKPISWKTFDNTKTPKEWAGEVRNIVYNL